MRTPQTDAPVAAASSRRAQIVRAAGELFRLNGYHATSMRELASSLNLRGASLYAHIGSKEELLSEIVHRAADEFLASARGIPPHLPPTEQLKRFVAGHLSVVERELETAAVFFHEWTHLSPAARERVITLRDAYERSLLKIIEAGVRTGEFRVADPRMAALLTLSTLNWSYQWLQPSGRLKGEALKREFTEYILRALGSGARSASSHAGEEGE